MRETQGTPCVAQHSRGPACPPQLYKNLWTSVLQERSVLERPAWWAEQAVHKPVPGRLKAQL